MTKRLLSVPEAAEVLGLTAKGLWTMIGRRDISSVKVGRLRRVSLEAVEEYIAARTIPARPARPRAVA
jgi:excisionase family DNA binding protein